MPKLKFNYRPLPEYLAIGPSDIEGAGIFATEDIPKGIIIGITHVYDQNFQHDYIRTPLGGFINHSKKANCELVEDDTETDYLNLKTSRKIKEAEEITLEYSLYEVCTGKKPTT